MSEIAITDKARILNLKKLKEATAEIENGVAYVEKVARKKVGNERATYLVR